jgi:hypothetical protein
MLPAFKFGAKHGYVDRQCDGNPPLALMSLKESIAVAQECGGCAEPVGTRTVRRSM